MELKHYSFGVRVRWSCTKWNKKLLLCFHEIFLELFNITHVHYSSWNKIQNVLEENFSYLIWKIFFQYDNIVKILRVLLLQAHFFVNSHRLKTFTTRSFKAPPPFSLSNFPKMLGSRTSISFACGSPILSSKSAATLKAQVHNS